MQNFIGPKALCLSTMEASMASKTMVGNMGFCKDRKQPLHETPSLTNHDFPKESSPSLDQWESPKVNLPEPEPIVEISLLLPNWQANILETEANSLGLSLAKMLRKVLLKHLESRTREALNS